MWRTAQKRADASISVLVMAVYEEQQRAGWGAGAAGWGGRPFLDQDCSLWLWTHYRSNQKDLREEHAAVTEISAPLSSSEQNFFLFLHVILPPTPTPPPPSSPPGSLSHPKMTGSKDFTRPLQTGSITNRGWEEKRRERAGCRSRFKTWIIRRHKKGNLSYDVCFNYFSLSVRGGGHAFGLDWKKRAL